MGVIPEDLPWDEYISHSLTGSGKLYICTCEVIDACEVIEVCNV